jgi:putative nucleotidyltransferase with HDIG domain
MGLIRNIRKGFMFLGAEYTIAPEDASLLARNLTDAERDLFLRLDPPDQEHSLRVTRKACEGLADYPQVDGPLVTKAALLHDVGKVGGHLGLLFRTGWVFTHRLVPYWLDAFARRGDRARPGSLRHKMWVQVSHAALGADMLTQTATDPAVVALVRSTGEEDSPDDSQARLILMAADADRVLTPDSEAKWREDVRNARL